MSCHPGTSPFIDATAVEAWDAWFRWREHGELQDLTIDATWERVVTALAAAEPRRGRSTFARALQNAFNSWQLLLDERIMASVGTSSASGFLDDRVAILNVASFVKLPCTPDASLDLARFEEVAGIAVHALDNAALLQARAQESNEQLRIGIVGFSDALALLGVDYDSEAGRDQAALVAHALAFGCLSGSIKLARDRVALMHCNAVWKIQARARGITQELSDEAMRHGLRYRNLTSITSQQRLALFANCVADALDPIFEGARTHVIETEGRQRRVRSSGYAQTMVRQLGSARPIPNGFTPVSVHAQCGVREAMQVWIDEPIVYPLHV